MKRLLSYDEHSDLSTIYHGNNDGTFTIQVHQDVAPYLRANAEARANASSGWKGDLHKVASIPTNIWNIWWKEFGSDPGASHNKARLAAKLNSNEFLKLRTKTGRM